MVRDFQAVLGREAREQVPDINLTTDIIAGFPGGTASYPSSVLMNAVPAKVAGVERLVMVVPSPDGGLNPLVLAAAALAVTSPSGVPLG